MEILDRLYDKYYILEEQMKEWYDFKIAQEMRDVEKEIYIIINT